ncbi:microbial collagenase [Streptomyces sp. 2333.5]|uniref:collagenase n=1 Tax=unclassified Streptomyces TaxID=2593676 RepID=UPI000897ECA5|nr:MULTISPECIES: collagenase [unclassified Streptomyces]PJJ00102.1 microbial collagenase [Streptomyces sp. 2333.5]SEB74949.1 microbial collagenase [Streptomyces sp. 2314.4]SEC61535.1 microbial collagenase [Streptomyces sp. 2112.2]
MRYRFTWPRCVVDSLAACTTIACLATPAAATPHAMAVAKAVPIPPTTSHPAPPPVGSTVSTGERPDVQGRPLSPTQLPPLRAQKPPTSFSAAASCSPGDFGSRTGAELVTAVKDATTECVNTLFSVTGKDAHDVFREEQMVTVANAFKDAAAAYSGDNSAKTLQLVLFLRAGYYVQDNHPDDVGDYGQNLAAPVEGGLDAFFANSHSKDVTSKNGDVLSEVVTLSDSANAQGRYLNVYKEVLSGYNNSYNDIPSMLASVNNVYTPLWRGNWNPEYVKAVTADPSIIDTLDSFARDHLDLLGTDKSYLDSNAGMNVGRYVEHAPLRDKVRPLMKGLLDASKITGKTAPLWVTVASQADSYDKDNCSYFGVCGLADQLTKAALPVSHNCDETHTIKAQSLTAADLEAACASVLKQDPYFHNLVKDSGPIPDQHESTIQYSVFGSRSDYQTYAGAIYGVDTNNGGITMIGDPTKPDNKPLSIMYQRDDDNGFPARIWNLNHEYTHYLDARDDMKGDFGKQTSVPDVWWIEGLAEYVSYGYRRITDTEAVTEAGKHTYKLSTLFQSTYDNSDVTRTYPWGYLAVRYMFEKHPDDIANMLGHFRTGDYEGGYAVYNTGIGTRYDDDFDTWLTACAAGACAAKAR